MGPVASRWPVVPWFLVAIGAVSFSVIAGTRLVWSGAPRVPAGMAAEVFDDEHLSRAAEYSSTAMLWSLTSLVVGLLTLAGLVWWSRTAGGRELLDRIPGPWWVAATLAVGAALAVQRVVTLPMAFMHWRNRVEFGMAIDVLSGWAGDVAMGWLISTLLVVVVVLVVLGSHRRWPRAWTAVLAGVMASGVILGSLAYPIAVEPLTHSFTPLPPGELRSAIEEMAHQEGVLIGDVVVADASQRTTVMNAWISGMGPTRRVVLYDTMVDDAPQELVLAVVAHEMAHAARGHVETGTALGASGVVMAMGLLGLCLGVRRRGEVAAEIHPSQALATALILAIALHLVSPVTSGVSRVMEREADTLAVQWTGDADDFVQLQVLLAERALSDPDPNRLSHFWWGTHPLTLERIASACAGEGVTLADSAVSADNERGDGSAGVSEQLVQCPTEHED